MLPGSARWQISFASSVERVARTTSAPVKETVIVAFSSNLAANMEKLRIGLHTLRPYDTELQPLGWTTKYLSSRVRLIRALGEKVARVHRAGNHGN
jgi:transposase